MSPWDGTKEMISQPLSCCVLTEVQRCHVLGVQVTALRFHAVTLAISGCNQLPTTIAHLWC